MNGKKKILRCRLTILEELTLLQCNDTRITANFLFEGTKHFQLHLKHMNI